MGFCFLVTTFIHIAISFICINNNYYQYKKNHSIAHTLIHTHAHEINQYIQNISYLSLWQQIQKTSTLDTFLYRKRQERIKTPEDRVQKVSYASDGHWFTNRKPSAQSSYQNDYNQIYTYISSVIAQNNRLNEKRSELFV